MKTKIIKCSVCGFTFYVLETSAMVERMGCYTPTYCKKMEKNKKMKNSSFPLLTPSFTGFTVES